MPAVIHLVRHAEGFHNLSPANHSLRDPDLTKKGHEQCVVVKSSFAHHDKIHYLIASPLRRTLYTAIESFTPLSNSSPAVSNGRTRVIATPLLQEVSTNPCDYGSPLDQLRAEFGDDADGNGKVDFSRVVDDAWLDKEKGSPWAPNMLRLQARAKEFRLWLRELAREADAGDGQDVHIAVVTHGGFLHFLTDDYDGLSKTYGTGWNNTERRSYNFADTTGEDPEARLKETKESWAARRGSEIPLTDSEQMEIKAVVRGVLKTEFSKYHEEDQEAVVD